MSAGATRFSAGIEAVEVGQQEAGRVADAPVGVGGALEDLVGDAHLGPVVGGRHPQADDVRAQGLHHVLGPHHVALGLGHLLALGVHREAVGQHLGVGRPVVHGHRGEQGGLEPAAVLVGALQVQIRGRAQSFAVLQHAGVGHAGVEPDVQGVMDLLVALAFRLAQQILGKEIEPGVDALLLHPPGHLLDEGRGIGVQLARLLVDQQGNGHAPGPLARDTPVRAVAHHAIDAGLAPVGHPVHLGDIAQGGLAQPLLLHADEPLGRGAEDDGGLVAPAVGIAVAEAGFTQQGAFGLEGVDHLLVGGEDVLAGEDGGAGQEAAVAPDRVVHRQVVAQADHIVLQAVPGGRVNGAGARVQGTCSPRITGTSRS